MSKIGFFIRFTLTYALVMAAAGITISILEVKSASSLNTVLLMAVAYWFFYSFSTKNSRIIEGNEKWSLIFLALAGDVLTSVVLGVPAMLANDLPLGYFLIGLAIITPLHFLVLVVVSFGVKRILTKHHPDRVKGQQAVSGGE
ncbi:ABZJ_00895 family protein [Marinimicrobium locisalis]|uniref:ABZJ_00895 family protein n=1 Tax=Marinimicrobium locisalis TaxID=546022 RepID=UPI00322212A9